MVHCPFCKWNRLADPSKGAPAFSQVRAVRELAVHLAGLHLEEFRELIQTVGDGWVRVDSEGNAVDDLAEKGDHELWPGEGDR